MSTLTDAEKAVIADYGKLRAFIALHPYVAVAAALILANLIGVVTHW